MWTDLTEHFTSLPKRENISCAVLYLNDYNIDLDEALHVYRMRIVPFEAEGDKRVYNTSDIKEFRLIWDERDDKKAEAELSLLAKEEYDRLS